uniref:LisH domain-containing protein n=1 Tax=Angiostrongylus cantonensis TaxID=6313 RepID=A0A0K0CU89_ANGCA
MSSGMFHLDDYQYGPRTSVALEPPFHQALNTPSIENLTAILKTWDASHRVEGFDPIPTLTSIAEIIEQAVDDFLKLDPDPLDDRHPARTHPQAEFGNLLKILFRNDDFMNKLVISYLLGRDQPELSVVAARVLLDCVPGLDAAEVFSEPSDFIPQLYIWAKDSSNEVLRAYSIGLLASALEVQGNAHKYRANNIDLMPVALRRLADLKARMLEERAIREKEQENTKAVAKPGGDSPGPFSNVNGFDIEENSADGNLGNSARESVQLSDTAKKTSDTALPPLVRVRAVSLRVQPPSKGNSTHDSPPPKKRKKVLKLLLEQKYYERNFQYLTSLLVHRKFALEFIARDGVSALVKVPRASMASPAAVTALYYLSYNEEIMEKVCQLNEKLLDDVVEYALWCLEHSYESGMGSAAMFFAHGFYYKPILERFDQRDGLRKLYNYISTLTLLQGSNKEKVELTEEQHLTSAEAVRNAVSDFKAYFEAHLFVKLEQIRRTVGNKILLAGCNYPAGLHANHRSYKSMIMDERSVREGVWLLTTALRASNSGWKPVDDVKKLGLIKTLFGVVILCHEFGSTGRSDTSVYALNALWLCTCVPKIHHELCEPMQLPNGNQADGMQIILEIVGGVILDDPNVRRAALNVLINCISLPDDISKPTRSASSERKDKESRRTRNAVVGFQSRENQEKIWAVIRKYNGINILLTVIRANHPIADADETRALACRALRELAKWEPVAQILSKLPFIVGNELQGLMRQPVMLEKRSEHLMFCDEAKKLIETVTQRPMIDKLANPKDLTQERLWKSHVIANTRVSYNEKELLQLIHDHLLRKGLNRTASQLVSEAELPDVPASRATTTPTRLPPMVSFRTSYALNFLNLVLYCFPSKAAAAKLDVWWHKIDDEHLILGTFSGEVHWLNMETGAIESHTVCHSSGITSIVPSKDGNFLLTSSAFISPLSALWKLGDQQEHAFDLAAEYFVQFPNLTSDRIISTNDVVATTAHPLRDLFNIPFLYILQWDTRTFRLLHLVPALEQCKLVFNSTGNIVYAAMYSDCADVFRNNYCASFRTFDAFDYSVIATVDTKRPLLDIACDHSDRYVVVVERTGEGEVEYMLRDEETVVRTYEVGKRRDAEDDDVDEVEDEDGTESDSDSFVDDEDMDDGDDDDDDDNDINVDEDEDDTGVFEAIGRLEAGSDSESSDASGSGSWVTDSNQSTAEQGDGSDYFCD